MELSHKACMPRKRTSSRVNVMGMISSMSSSGQTNLHLWVSASTVICAVVRARAAPRAFATPACSGNYALHLKNALNIRFEDICRRPYDHHLLRLDYIRMEHLLDRIHRGCTFTSSMKA